MLEKYRSYACMELVSLICPRTKRNETKRNTGGGDLQRATCGRKSVLSTASTRRGDSRSHAATLPALLLPFCLPVVLHQLQLIIIFAKLALPRPPPRRPGPDELPYSDRKRRVFYIHHIQSDLDRRAQQAVRG